MKKNTKLFLAGLCCIALHLSSSAYVLAGTGSATTSDEYIKEFSHITQQRTVRLPSGATFRLNVINEKEFHRMLKEFEISIPELNDMVDRDFGEMPGKEKDKYIDFRNKLIVKYVENPKMCIEDEEGKLPIRILTPDDFDYLLRELTVFPDVIQAVTPEISVKTEQKKKNRLSVTNLILSPEKYEGKKVNLKGVVSRTLKEITISGGERKVIFQRFYLFDNRNTILVFWFSKEKNKLSLKPTSLGSMLLDLEEDDPWIVYIRKGTFTTKLISQPVIIGHCRDLSNIQQLWIQTIHNTLSDYQ